MRITIILILIFFSGLCIAQTTYQYGILPSVNLNTKIKKNWILNAKAESRFEIINEQINDQKNLITNYLLADFSLITARKISIDKTIGLGYLMRLKDGNIYNRFLQQYIFSHRFPGLSIAHRLATEQTISKKEATEIGLRYRIAANIPMNGQSVDPGEFYLKISNEYLNLWEKASYNLEVRLTPHLGFKIRENNKIEIDMDYRIDSFFNKQIRNRFFTSVNWYLSL